MHLEPLHDLGQKLPPLSGHVIGEIDSRRQLDEIVDDLENHAIPVEDMLLLEGEEGVRLVKRGKRFFFSDSETEMAKIEVQALRNGHLILEIKVQNAKQAREIAQVAKQHGGHHFMHFGMLVNTALN